VHAQVGIFGQIILEKGRKGQKTVGGSGHISDGSPLSLAYLAHEVFHTVQGFSGAQKGKVDPAFGAADELAVEAYIEAGGVSARIVFSGVADADVVDVVRDQVPHALVISLGDEAHLDRSAAPPQKVVGESADEVNRPLGAQVRVYGAV
jgi:hypothetical protein